MQSTLYSVLESKWPTILLAPIFVSNHIITVTSTVGLKVRQIVTLKKTGIVAKNYVIKRVLSDTQLQIGLIDPQFNRLENPTEYDGGSLEMYEQERNKMGSELIIRAVYDEEPTVALRNVLVDEFGRYYNSNNFFPIISKPSNDDAFGRTRISEVFSLGDYKHIYDDTDHNVKTLNGGTATTTANNASVTLTTSSNPASSVQHQTKAYHPYQPGKSQLIYSSICFGYAEKNVTKRTGYFDNNNGIYFEQVGSNTSNKTDNGQLNFVIRSKIGGTPSEANIGSYLRRVPQQNWNIDRCDGTGPSKFNINTSKTQLIYIDFQWLGVGRVRCGFVHNGQVIVAHEYYHSNVLETPYLSNPNLPVRCEIFNTGETAGGKMEQICSTVISEGGYIEAGKDFSASTGIRTTLTPGRTYLPVLAVRLSNTYNGLPNRIGVKIINSSIYAEVTSIEYVIVKIPNASYLATTAPGGLVWTSTEPNVSATEYCLNATSLLPVVLDPLSTGFITAGTSQNSTTSASATSLSSAVKNIIYQNMDSTDSEVYVVLARTLSSQANATANVAVSLQWREIV
jgi:hypothetical protein